MAEEFAFEGAIGEGSGVDGDDGAGGAGGDGVEGLGDHFLSGSVLAGDEDVGVGGADAGNGGEDGLHRRRGGDHFREAVGAEDAVLGFKMLGAADGVLEVDLGAEDGEQTGVVPGLLNEVLRASAHGFNGQLDIGPGGHDNDGHLRVVGLDPGEEVEALLSGGGVACVVEVDEEGVVGPGLEGFEDGVRGAGLFDAETFGSEKKIEGVEDVGLVVGDEERGLAGFCGVGHE